MAAGNKKKIRSKEEKAKQLARTKKNKIRKINKALKVAGGKQKEFLLKCLSKY